MAAPASVAVNPQSSTDARSGALSGVGDQSFYFGPNPNLAAVFGGGSSNTLLWVGLAVVVAWLLFHRRA